MRRTPALRKPRRQWAFAHARRRCWTPYSAALVNLPLSTSTGEPLRADRFVSAIARKSTRVATDARLVR